MSANGFPRTGPWPVARVGKNRFDIAETHARMNARGSKRVIFGVREHRAPPDSHFQATDVPPTYCATRYTIFSGGLSVEQSALPGIFPSDAN
jgi:hypothetical protein